MDEHRRKATRWRCALPQVNARVGEGPHGGGATPLLHAVAACCREPCRAARPRCSSLRCRGEPREERKRVRKRGGGRALGRGAPVLGPEAQTGGAVPRRRWRATDGHRLSTASGPRGIEKMQMMLGFWVAADTGGFVQATLLGSAVAARWAALGEPVRAPARRCHTGPGTRRWANGPRATMSIGRYLLGHVVALGARLPGWRRVGANPARAGPVFHVPEKAGPFRLLGCVGTPGQKRNGKGNSSEFFMF